MVTVVQGNLCAKNHPDRLSRLATIHQRYRRTDGRISYGIGLDLTVGQKCYTCVIKRPAGAYHVGRTRRPHVLFVTQEPEGYADLKLNLQLVTRGAMWRSRGQGRGHEAGCT